MEFLADLHNIPILVVDRVLDDEGIPTDEPINLVLAGIKLRSLLKIMLEDLGLTYIIEDEVMKITTLLDASALWWEQHRQYAAAYLRFRFQQLKQGEAGQTSSDMAAAYAALIAKAQEVDEVRVDESAIRLANYLHFLILYALMTWLESPTASLRDELAHAFEFFMLGAKPR